MKKNIHFSGVGGVGMSALAQMATGGEYTVSGSDRDFDRGQKKELREKLEKAGVLIYPQDGSGVTGNTVRLVVSTAIEDTNPEIRNAHTCGVPVVHRSEVLAEYVNSSDTVVVSGTSGKSTVVAMIFRILEYAGLQPSVITGGSLRELMERGLAGNAFRGKGTALIVEGDESDGSLVRYKPAKGLALNITKDHKTIDELKKIFLEFRGNCGEFAWNQNDPVCAEIFPGGKGTPYGVDINGYRVENRSMHPFSSDFTVSGISFHLPVPGEYNIENAVAACAGAAMYGVSLETAAVALAGFAGVDRRFVLTGEKNGIRVVDDFAHNPAKIAAVLSALHGAGKRVFAVYQPHGFTPTRNLRTEIVRSLTEGLSEDDFLFMPEIYYAGGTVNKTISSADIVEDVLSAGKNAKFFPDRSTIPAAIADMARPGDIIGVMGARDATLSDLASEILEAL